MLSNSTDTCWRTSTAKATKLCDALKHTTATTNVEERLHNVARDITTVQQRLLAKEDTVLNGGKYAESLQLYRDAKERLEFLRTRHADLSSTVGQQNEELTELTDRHDATKKSIKDKGRRMTDTAPLIRIKTAIQTVREEMQDMDVRIGILSHLQLQSQLAMAKRNKRQQQHHGGLGGGHYVGIDSSDCDEDDDDFDDDEEEGQ
mmetsp:Transcript_16864/g.48451  ORF Transcript_16864/g.48451 Transcript_16864/m.48451 type:complete len:204 (+) Transcript_16864:3197-3808(+)